MVDKVQGQEELIVLPPEETTETSELEREDLIELAKEAELRIDAIKRIITAALKVTSINDWVSQGYGEKSRPYLCASGAEKIANLFRVQITNVHFEKVQNKDDLGSYYYYVYTCTGILPKSGRVVDGIEGTCSSRDQFFAKAGEDAEGKAIYKPESEVDETNIRKAAHSNMIVRAISSLLGLRNLDWEQIKAAGIDISRIAQVNYQSKSVNKTQSPERTKMENETWQMLLEMNNEEPEAARKQLKEITTFKGDRGVVQGKDNLADFSDKWLASTYKKVKELAIAYRGGK